MSGHHTRRLYQCQFTVNTKWHKHDLFWHRRRTWSTLTSSSGPSPAGARTTCSFTPLWITTGRWQNIWHFYWSRIVISIFIQSLPGVHAGAGAEWEEPQQWEPDLGGGPQAQQGLRHQRQPQELAQHVVQAPQRVNKMKNVTINYT